MKTRSFSITERKLENYEEKLRKACHLPECIYFRSCPSSCCSEHLGFHTAIMWALANHLSTIRESIQFKITMVNVYKEENTISTLTWVAYQHRKQFKGNQYRLFKSACDYSFELINYLQENLRELGDNCRYTSVFRA